MKAPGGKKGILKIMKHTQMWLSYSPASLQLFSQLFVVKVISVKLLTASILVAKVWEPPHIPKTHAESHLGQHVLDFGVPRWPVLIRCLSYIWTVYGC